MHKGRIMVVAGETSGDMHAARIVRELKNRVPGLEFFGMGSTRMAGEGVEILIDPLEFSTIGFADAIPNLRSHLNHLKILKRRMKLKQPDAALLVDYSGFNMMMARTAAKMGVPVVNCFPPSAWIWGKWRAKWMARYNAVIAAVLPQERDVYRQAGAEVKFVGHPLLDIAAVDKNKKEIHEFLELEEDRMVVGLLPGSRNKEIERLLDPMLSAAVSLSREFPELQFVLPLAEGVDGRAVREQVAGYSLIVKIVEGLSYEVMEIADLLVTASGTATLEAAIRETPMVVVYKTGDFTYKLANFLVNSDYIALPSIIAGKQVVPELLQDEVTSHNIYEEVSKLLRRPYLINDMSKSLGKIKRQLGKPGAAGKIADLVLEKGEIVHGE
ncbi:MAG: lipid-A-disaccharide synthase [Halanaerobiaceae bacterium]